MANRLSGNMGNREENYEHVLMCLICRSLFDDFDHQPKFLPCHHTFCKDCLREYVRQSGDEIECPSCRKIAMVPAAGVTALQTNFYVKYIQSLVQGYSDDGRDGECSKHNKKLKFFCRTCNASICDSCLGDPDNDCGEHKYVPLSAVTEEYHQKLDRSFAKANSMVEQKKVVLEAMLKGLSLEKDESLKKIESVFEQHVHTLTRRSTLLKNKVIAIYNEHIEKLEMDLEEIATGMTCIVSLKEYHENLIVKGYFMEIDRGIEDVLDVYNNIKEHIQPKENHIIFEDKHGVEKFREGAKDLGRVRSTRPTAPRTDPEGTDGAQDVTCISSPKLSIQPGKTGVLSPPQNFNNQTVEDIYQSPSPVDVNSPVKINNKCFIQGKHIDSTLSKDCDNMESKAIGDNIFTKLDGESSVSNNNPPAPSTKLSSPKQVDINLNTKISAPVVRPKVLPTNSINCKSSKKSEYSFHTKPYSSKQSAHSLPKAVHDAPIKAMPTSGPSGAPRKVSDSAASQPLMEDPSLLGPMASLPELDHLKKTDKMYHHLVYTSYDEEELLRELRTGKAHFEMKVQRSMEDSDSWITVSSESTLSGNSDDNYPNPDQIFPDADQPFADPNQSCL